ncbi:4-hydroxyphenylpyruvate dioxygenase [Saccharomonospora sp. NPDC046836]|uniref:4-hydroxyphenylpyruvate dioxygenase n=1 Tax=Saccharomonospora sp. NPDC046836 TaxID=3156921 RepID=UPI0033EEA3F3
MEIQSIDHIELFVEDAEETALGLRDQFGFVVAGRGGARTSLRGCESVLLRQHDITLLVTSATSPDHRAAEYVGRHGDGVAVIALRVGDARAAFADTVGRGAVPVAPPVTSGPAGAQVTFASVIAFGDVEHRFVSRARSGGPFAPRIEETGAGRSGDGLLREVDHLAVCTPAGTLDETVYRYEDIFGLRYIFDERIIVGSQAMNSKVVQSDSGRLTLTIIEPDVTRDPGQIDRFIAAHDGAGVQHIAFLTEDILTAVPRSAVRGVRFLTTPPSYYEALPARLGPIGVPAAALRELNVLADRDDSGIMLQIFTESRHEKGTLFYELIDRRGARTFGSNNIHALYEAVQRQQDTIPTRLD